jgi:hypothetical protein
MSQSAKPSKTTAPSSRCRARRPSRRRFLPGVDPMEDRALLSGTLTVTNSHDSGPGSLRAAIAAAPDGDTIKFAGSLRGQTIALTSGELLITTSIDIDGLGSGLVAVSGGGAGRVFEVDAGLDVTISGLTITDGFAPDEGGGILNDGSNLTLSGDALTRNVASESASSSGAGGALYSLGGTVNISGCQIDDNQALGGAGASAFGDAFGGGLDIQGGSASLVDSTLSGNEARGGADSGDGLAGGGALFTQVPTGITDCIITDNKAIGGDDTPNNGAYGGALDIYGSSTTIMGCTISGDQAVGGAGGSGAYIGNAEGGAINDYGSLTITGSVFDQDQALAGSGGNSGPGDLESFEDYSFGGAIACTEAPMSITGTVFSGDKAVGGNNSIATATDFAAVGGSEGGAIYNELGATSTIVGCNFDGNEAVGGDGDSGSGSVVLVGEGLGGAIVSGFGGDVYGPDTLSVLKTNFNQNGAHGGDNDTGIATVAGLVGTGAGAGIANYSGASTNISNSALIDGQASGGSLDTAGGTGTVLAGVGTGGGVFNFLGNYSSPGYGDLNASAVAISNSAIQYNQALGGEGGGEGGGIAGVFDATTMAADSIITQNFAGGAGVAGLGGGAYNDATSSLALTASMVTLNQADGTPGVGGGIYTLGTFTYDGSTIILFNHASTSGDNVGS